MKNVNIAKITKDINRLNRTVKINTFLGKLGKLITVLMLVLTAADAFMTLKKA